MRTVPPVSPGEMLDEEFLKPLGLTKYRLATAQDQRKMNSAIVFDCADEVVGPVGVAGDAAPLVNDGERIHRLLRESATEHGGSNRTSLSASG